jgi:predicted ATP-binding protein involved in virulence
MLKIKQLILNNVGPFKSQKIDFSVEEGHPNIHIFTGSNGSGKTTILHAIASEFDFFENEHKEHISNNFVKRFHFASEDTNEFAMSYAHCILTEDESDKVSDKIICYKCKNCGNLHQNYEKTISNNLKIAKSGNGYQHNPHSIDLKNYKNAIVSEDISSKKFKFAAFGYSGYRLITSSKIELNSIKSFNPLHLALEFVKERNTGFGVSNWIVSRFAKAAVEESIGNKDLAKKYKAALICFIESINDLTNSAFIFEVKTNPWKVVFKHFGQEVEFDVLPDGLRSLLSWLGDLLMRLDNIPWEDNSIPVNEQNIVLLLDEIEVHLHPKWQYEILPLVQKIFPNAQIFLSTHSPFIINSIDNAKVYVLDTDEGCSTLKDVVLSNTGDSYQYVNEEILGITNSFGKQTMKNLTTFYKIDAELVEGNFEHEHEFKDLVQVLLEEGDEVKTHISSKLFRLNRITGKDYINGKN